ncbi:MAG: VWA domain-containing protein [Planctomycetes bacterium]|nr:VWA domain-containing protein [Planctomycetota bacterium]
MRRLPVYLLIDCSESMAGPAIETVYSSVDRMVRDLRASPHSMETVVMSVITFSAEARLVVPLTPIDMFQLPTLSIRPGTSLGRALDLLASCLVRDVVRTTSDRKGDWRPLVFLFTDGQPTDDWRGALDRIKALASPRIANIYAIGSGEDADFAVLKEITDVVLKAEDISKAFVWITASIQSASKGMADGMDFLPELGEEYGMKEVARGDYTPDQDPRQVFINARCSKTKGDYLMRFRREHEEGPYVATAAHKLNDYDAGFGTKLPAIQSSRLVGVPACPYCGNVGAAVCGCGGVMCVDLKKQEGLVCPHCGMEQKDGFTTGSFDVRQSAG